MSTKCSQLFLPQLGNRSSLNPSCFKEKQRPESDFPGAKVAGIPKSPIRVSAKNPKTAALPCRTTRTLKERSVFPANPGRSFRRRRPRRRTGVGGSPRRKPAVFFKGFAFPFGARSVLFGTARHNEFARIKILLKKANAPGDRSLSPHPSRLRRATFPGGEGFGEWIVIGGNPRRGTHQCEHRLAITCFVLAIPAQENRVPKNRDAVEICAIQPISP